MEVRAPLSRRHAGATRSWMPGVLLIAAGGVAAGWFFSERPDKPSGAQPADLAASTTALTAPAPVEDQPAMAGAAPASSGEGVLEDEAERDPGQRDAPGASAEEAGNRQPAAGNTLLREPHFAFPTENHALLASRPEEFFMFVDRYTPEGQIQVWQGGDYGFVRNPRQTPQGTVYTKFHEGIDIAPAARDGKGEPLDEVHAVADGTVAYITGSPRTSNYGHYVVVLHPLEGSGVFYSLYAHLRSISAVAGMEVKRGHVLGKMGYTGDGLDRRRAHVHLEIGLILSERFDLHYGSSTALANPHGNYHGSNLIGMNAGAFLTEHLADPALMPDRFLKRQEVYFKVTVPNRGHELEIARRYPWLRTPGEAGTSWEIAFTAPGVPVAVVPSAQSVTFPSVTWVKPFAGYHSWNTRSLLGGSGVSATLTAQGQRFLTLVSGDF